MTNHATSYLYPQGQTHTYTYRHPHKSNFKKPGMPGFKNLETINFTLCRNVAGCRVYSVRHGV